MKTIAELIAEITLYILSGGRRTTAANVRILLNDFLTSFYNKADDTNVNDGVLGIDTLGKVDVSFIKKDTPTGQYLKDDGTWETIDVSTGFKTDDITYNAGWDDGDTLVMLPNVVYKIQETTVSADKLLVSFGTANDGDQFMITDGSVNGNINSVVWISGMANYSPFIVMNSNETLIFTKSDGIVWLTSRTNKTDSTEYTDAGLALKADIASPTFTGTVTTPDVIVSGATVNTIAHFDASKNIESLPLASYPSLTELSYVKGVTSAIQTQIDARSTAYAIPNYYRVDLNLGDDLTGVAGREDKPYLTIQTVWDLITTGSTAQITIEIVGDFTFTTHAILTSVAKDNITFLFKGKIVYAVPATTVSRPLFTFTGANNNLTFVVPNYTQTTQGGFIYTNTSSGHRYIIDNIQIKMGIDTTLNNNIGFYSTGGAFESYFQCNSLTVDIAENSIIKNYQYPFYITNCNYRINTFKITGTCSVASSRYSGFYGVIKSLYIENLSNDNSYTNLIQFNLASALSCDNVFINNINIASNGSALKTDAFALFSTITSCKNLTIMTGSILNFSTVTNSETTIENINLGTLIINGIITYNYFSKNINLLGNLTKTVATDTSWIYITQNATINGNGFKIYHADPTYLSGASIIQIQGVSSGKAVFINNLTIYNTNIATAGTSAFIPIMYTNSLGITLRVRNLVVSSQIDSNSHTDTTFIRPLSGNTAYVCRIEGNVATNYVKSITNLTNECQISLITGYRF